MPVTVWSPAGKHSDLIVNALLLERGSAKYRRTHGKMLGDKGTGSLREGVEG